MVDGTFVVQGEKNDGCSYCIVPPFVFALSLMKEEDFNHCRVRWIGRLLHVILLVDCMFNDDNGCNQSTLDIRTAERKSASQLFDNVLKYTLLWLFRVVPTFNLLISPEAGNSLSLITLSRGRKVLIWEEAIKDDMWRVSEYLGKIGKMELTCGF